MPKIEKHQQQEVVNLVADHVSSDKVSTAKATQLVAEVYGVTPTRIYEIWREHNPRVLSSDDPRASIIRMRNEGVSLKKVAEAHGCSTNKVVQTCKIYRLDE